MKKSNNLVKESKLLEQEELIGYLKEQNESQRDEIREYKQYNIDLEEKILSSDLEIAKASNEIEEKEKKIELLEDRIKYLENTIEKYQQLPDLKNMIDNLSSLTTPSIDKLVEIMKDNKFDSFASLEDGMKNIASRVEKIHEHIDCDRR